MLAINYQMANKYGIKYILSGTNTFTEGFKIPSNWSWFKNDKKIFMLLLINLKKFNLQPCQHLELSTLFTMNYTKNKMGFVS